MLIAIYSPVKRTPSMQKFQSLIGINVNCNKPFYCAERLNYLFQSLIGINVNCNKS